MSEIDKKILKNFNFYIKIIDSDILNNFEEKEIKQNLFEVEKSTQDIPKNNTSLEKENYSKFHENNKFQLIFESNIQSEKSDDLKKLDAINKSNHIKNLSTNSKSRKLKKTCNFKFSYKIKKFSVICTKKRKILKKINDSISNQFNNEYLLSENNLTEQKIKKNDHSNQSNKILFIDSGRNNNVSIIKNINSDINPDNSCENFTSKLTNNGQTSANVSSYLNENSNKISHDIDFKQIHENNLFNNFKFEKKKCFDSVQDRIFINFLRELKDYNQFTIKYLLKDWNSKINFEVCKSLFKIMNDNANNEKINL